MAGLIPELNSPMWTTPPEEPSIELPEAQWHRDMQSGDVIAAAIAHCGLKGLREKRKAELQAFLEEDIAPYLDAVLAPFVEAVPRAEREEQRYRSELENFLQFWAHCDIPMEPPFPADALAFYIVSRSRDGARVGPLARFVRALEQRGRIEGDVSFRTALIRAALKLAAANPKPTDARH